jgi:large subunit ribosomal protein L21
MFAVVKTGGKQYRVSVGDKIQVERLPYAVGDQVTLNDVLMLKKDDAVMIGTPTVAGAAVVARVIGEGKGDKVIHFDYRSKHRRRRTHGHRQWFTELEIVEIRN